MGPSCSCDVTNFFVLTDRVQSLISIQMAVSKDQKVAILATLEAHLKDAQSVAFTTNQKLTVLEVSNMKKEIRAVGGHYMIAKKTLIRIAFKNVMGVDLDINTLPGQVAILIAKEDKIAPLGVVGKFAKEKDFAKEEKIKFSGGYIDGRVLDAAETTKLASLPSREVLLAKLLGSMMSPLSSLARFFDAAKKDIESKGGATVGDLTKAIAAAAPVVAAVEAAPVAAEATPAPEATAEEAPAAEAAPEAPADAPAAE
jgi:large subunit ribosomal protein L10